jgi:hypothetical protein
VLRPQTEVIPPPAAAMVQDSQQPQDLAQIATISK